MYYTKLLATVSLLTIMISEIQSQNVGIGTLSPDSTFSIQNKLMIGGSQGDIIFTDDHGSITFPTTTAPNSAMMHMFNSGFSNDDRMVIGHSPASTTWGLQYQDLSDKFNFLGAGVNVATFDLANRRMGIGTNSPATQFHFFSSSSSTMRFEGPNNFFDIYSTNPANLSGLRFYNEAVFSGGMFYSPGDDYVFIGPSASTSNNLIWMDLSGARKLSLGANALPVDHDVAIGGNVQIVSGDEASLATHGYLQTGSTTGINLIMDNNEIAARNNGAESPLYLQPNQGNVVVGSTGGFTEKFVVEGEDGVSAVRVRTQLTTRFAVDSVGAVLINSATLKKTGYELNVNGQIVAEEVLVQNSTDWPDFVFEDDYNLRQLSDIEAFINEHKHLPDVPSAAQIQEDGILLGEMDKTLLRKIEEITLHMIQQSKDIAQLKLENVALKLEIKNMKE